MSTKLVVGGVLWKVGIGQQLMGLIHYTHSTGNRKVTGTSTGERNEKELEELNEK
jgi:hypothetical protein